MFTNVDIRCYYVEITELGMWKSKYNKYGSGPMTGTTLELTIIPFGSEFFHLVSAIVTTRPFSLPCK